MTPGTNDGKIVCVCYSLIGIPLFLIHLSRINRFINNTVSKVYEKVMDIKEYKSKRKKVRFAEVKEIYDYETDDLTISSESSSDESEQFNEQKKIKVQIMVSVIIYFTYMLFGGFLFRFSEDWSFINALYFSFVTLTSMGFGMKINKKSFFFVILFHFNAYFINF